MGFIRKGFLIIGNGTGLFFGYSLYSGNERFYREVAMPCLRLLSPENAHRFAVWSASKGLVPKSIFQDPPIMHTSLWGIKFSNPVGLAAGFDKHAEAIEGLQKMGFGFVEVGSVTPEPQLGNPKPRVFRLQEDKAVINRYGFNSEGHEAALKRLKGRHQRNTSGPNGGKGIVGINFGKNKTSPDPVGDYTKGVASLGMYGDYLVVNISSPNTPGLRDMQGRKQLAELIDKVLAARNDLPREPRPPLLVKIAPDLTEQDKTDIADVIMRPQVLAARNDLPREPRPPLLVKIAPDLTEQDKTDIADVIMRPQSRVDGLIISNTTVSRPASLLSSQKIETGGLSGQPLKQLSTEAIKDMYRLTKGTIPIVGVGGISSGKDAYEKIRAGASLVQIYTALTYEGPPLVTRIKRELAHELQSGGFESIEEAVGADHR